MILHLDLDSFFASAERTVDRTLLNRPIAVGGRSNLSIFSKEQHQTKMYNPNSGAFVSPVFHNNQSKGFKEFFVDQIHNRDKIRGIITTASYEARARGVKTAMSINEALQRCPELVVVPPNYILYNELSHQLRSYLESEIPSIEQFSIDEFFGDVTGWIDEEEVFEFAQHLQHQIAKQFGLPISIGISSAKWIAKLATEFAKPKGIYMVKKDDIEAFIEDIPIEEFPGIGSGFSKRLHRYGIEKLGEVKEKKHLFYSWKMPGVILYKRILGIDNESISKEQDRKSIGISRTFDPIHDRDEIRRRITVLARHIAYMVLKQQVNPTTFYIKANYDFGHKVKLRKTTDRLFNEKLIKELMLDMFEAIDIRHGHITKLAMNVSNFTYQKRKPFDLIHFKDDEKQNRLSKAMQKMREKHSLDIIKTGGEL
jgi:DNA polymerase-4